MTGEKAKFQAWFFIFLLAGSQVAQVDAVRQSMSAVSELRALLRTDSAFSSEAAREGSHSWASGGTSSIAEAVPTDDSGCTRAANGTCSPMQYCVYKRTWFSLSRDASCQLETIYQPDQALAAKYAEHSGMLVRRAEKFRTHGSIMRLQKMRSNLNVVSLLNNAAESDVPPKPTLNDLKASFRQQTIHEYWQKLEGMLPDLLPAGSDALKGAAFSEQSLQANALDRTIESLDQGMDTSMLLRAIKKNVNLAKVMEVTMKPSTDPSLLTQQIHEAFPTVGVDRISEVTEKTLAEEAQIHKTCNGDETCERSTVLKARESILEKIAEKEEGAQGSLLELARSLGVEGAAHLASEEEDAGAHAGALLMLEQHLEKVWDEDEHQGLVDSATRNGLLLIISIVLIVVLCTTACMTIAGCGVTLIIFAVLSGAFGIGGIVGEGVGDIAGR